MKPTRFVEKLIEILECDCKIEKDQKQENDKTDSENHHFVGPEPKEPHFCLSAGRPILPRAARGFSAPFLISANLTTNPTET